MDVLAPQAQLVLDNPTAFDTADHVFDADAQLGHPPVLSFGLWRQFTASRLFVRLLDRNVHDGKALKAQVLIQDTLRRQHIHVVVGKTLIMPAPFVRGTQKTDLAIGGNQDEVLERVALFLAAVVEALFVRVTGSVDGALGAIMEKRDGSAGADNGAAPSGVAPSAAERWGRCPASANA